MRARVRGPFAWRTTASLVAIAVTMLPGCPRDLEPPPPGDAESCGEHADCNFGASCGFLALCVGGFCAEEPSVVVPCP